MTKLRYMLILGVLIVSSIAAYVWYSGTRTVILYEELPQELSVQDMNTEMQEGGEISKMRYPVIPTLLHPATGTVQILEAEGTTYVRFESFKTVSGPDLFVYLSKDTDATDFVSLGVLKATEGDINYKIPVGVSVEEYPYVLVWCKQFGVLFNYAHIEGNMHADSVVSEESVEEVTDTNAERTSQPIETYIPGAPPIRKTAIFANGCFWCAEHDFEKVEGVLDVVSGYTGGNNSSPTYKNYGEHSHREAVLVTYDDHQVHYENLVEHVIKHGDPTDNEGSFYDRGKEYAPAIYYETEIEKEKAQHVINQVEEANVFEKPVLIELLSRSEFYPAEAYHQDYGTKNPVRYEFYRTRSGRDDFINKHWGARRDIFDITTKPVRVEIEVMHEPMNNQYETFVKPDETTLRDMLSPLAYTVTQEEGTEPPFQNEYYNNSERGIYVDVVSGEPLFSSRDKYDSGTGWPSFTRPIGDDMVTLHEDGRLFLKRTEVRSRYADSHLGHVFDDGPKDEGGKRYCMNSVALRFIPFDKMKEEGYEDYLDSV